MTVIFNNDSEGNPFLRNSSPSWTIQIKELTVQNVELSQKPATARTLDNSFRLV